MADTATVLLDDVKDYLNITWQDDATDKKITGFLNRGMKRLQVIAGASLDFSAEDMPRALLFDYCRYANSQALEVFEKNFEAELLELNLTAQVSIIEKLIVMAMPVSAYGKAAVKVAPALSENNSYVYQVGTGLKLPARLDTCAPAEYAAWHGEYITAAIGQDILIVEVNGEYGAERAGIVTVSA